ncbi:hypothetical protein [Paraburkholderia elongata]|uniref:Uncharacterized protein n=1 Tax=Paraburkholderia elongata TaxID=2675747 RepID=A0A972SM59_9BURK|nr:hypothetical protein [Paraburkholderia elongata]NPT60838.1 hypothetical protein [Paraburkholderia elongata]
MARKIPRAFETHAIGERVSSEAKVIAPPEMQLLEFSASAARPLPDSLPTSEK